MPALPAPASASASSSIEPSLLNEAPTGAVVHDDGELNAILGSGTALSGRLSFAGRVRVEGQFEGELLGGELIVIAGDAKIQGTVSARHVLILSGEVHADITATGSIELCVPAIVVGDLKAPEVFLERGVSFSGKCTMGSDVR